ncbi:MAG: C1 family peptidase [Anaerolineae bacterium]|nr:C1 family peptidase [Anaerolineae bacterium]
MTSKAIHPEQIQHYADAFAADPRNHAVMNALTQENLSKVGVNRRMVTRLDHSYSHKLKSNPITNQMHSGRCWLFAGLNTFRYYAMEKMKLDAFEFSQNYPMFWDKFEKANYFLESILGTLDEASNSRLIMHLVRDPIQDGGQWDMFVNLIRKYGVVPKTVMPETESSGNTGAMDAMITAKLREYAAELRKAHAAGAALDALRERKLAMMSTVYRMLCLHLGEPPKSFYWQWNDKEDAFHRDGEITPQAFYDKYVGLDLDSMVCLINAPTADKPFNRLFTVDYLGNVVEGEIIRYINVEIDVMKQAAMRQIVDDKRAVWFGCDVGKDLERVRGIMAEDTYDYENIYGEPFTADKADRLDYGQSMMTHAMVFTAVDVDEAGKPVKWRVENSWDDKNGDKGFYIMTDNWFSEYMYEVVVDRKFVPAEVLAALETEPIHLAPWDPMGALAAAA